MLFYCINSRTTIKSWASSSSSHVHHRLVSTSIPLLLAYATPRSTNVKMLLDGHNLMFVSKTSRDCSHYLSLALNKKSETPTMPPQKRTDHIIDPVDIPTTVGDIRRVRSESDFSVVENQPSDNGHYRVRKSSLIG